MIPGTENEQCRVRMHDAFQTKINEIRNLSKFGMRTHKNLNSFKYTSQ